MLGFARRTFSRLTVIISLSLIAIGLILFGINVLMKVKVACQTLFDNPSFNLKHSRPIQRKAYRFPIATNVIVYAHGRRLAHLG